LFLAEIGIKTFIGRGEQMNMRRQILIALLAVGFISQL